MATIRFRMDVSTPSNALIPCVNEFLLLVAVFRCTSITSKMSSAIPPTSFAHWEKWRHHPCCPTGWTLWNRLTKTMNLSSRMNFRCPRGPEVRISLPANPYNPMVLHLWCLLTPMTTRKCFPLWIPCKQHLAYRTPLPRPIHTHQIHV